MTKNTPRIFISLLLMLLCIGILPVSAFASGGDYPDDARPAAESSAAAHQIIARITSRVITAMDGTWYTHASILIYCIPISDNRSKPA